MEKNKSQLLRKLIAISLAATLAVGGLPTSMGGLVDLGTGIVANAVATEVSSTTGFIAAVKNVGEIKFTDDIKDADVTVTAGTYVSDGSTELKPDVTVTLNGEELNPGTDYDVEYSDNIAPGIATVTVTGKGSYCGTAYGEFTVFALLTEAPADVNVYKTKTELADTVEGKYVIDEGYYIVSDKQLTFGEDQLTYVYYEPGNRKNPFEGKYTYKVDTLSSNVTASHVHTYHVQTAGNKLNVKCDGEPGDYETIAELTIAEGNYEYGDRVDIEAKAYARPHYDVAKTDVEFGGIYFKNKENTSIATTTMPTALGKYSVEIGATFFLKNHTRYSLYKEFEIGKKDIAHLVKPYDSTAEKKDYITVALKPAEGEPVSGYTVEYDGKLYTPVIKLVNSVYNYDLNKYEETELVENTDYTATLTPQSNAGVYKVTITAKEGSKNYKGEGSFNWNITKRNFVGLSITDNRTAEEKVYDGQAVAKSDFTVSGLGTEANPGTAEGNTFTYKWYKRDTDPESQTVNQFVAMDESLTPVDAGEYKVEITVHNDNYNDTTLEKNFTVEQRTATIMPKEGNNITYGDDFDPEELKYDVSGLVQGDTLDMRDVHLDVIDDEGDAFAAGDILNAGKYDYVLDTEEDENNPNYRIVLSKESKFIVAKKALTASMFTVDPLELTYNSKEQEVTVTAEDTKMVKADPESYETELPYLLIEDTDWTIFNNTNKGTNVGQYTVIVEATEDGNYKGTVELTDKKWSIIAENINEADVAVVPTTATYTAEEITPTVTVTYDGKKLIKGTDYDLAIESGTNVGEYNWSVTGKGNFKETKTGKWTITPADIYSVKVSSRNKVYDGKAVEDKDFRVTTKLLEGKANADALAPNEANISYTYEYYSVTEEGQKGTLLTAAPKDSGTYIVAVTANAGNNFNKKTEDHEFIIKKRKVELYPNEGQSASYGANYSITFTYERAEEGTITGVVGNDTPDFSNALMVDTSAGNGTGFYPIVINPAYEDTYNNYTPWCDGTVDFEITKTPLVHEWFTLEYDGSNETFSETTTFNENAVKVKVVPTNIAPENIMDEVDISGTTVAYLPEADTYKVYVKAKKTSNKYIGTETYQWKIGEREMAAIVIVDDNSSSESSGSSGSGYYYNAKTPAVDIISNNSDGIDVLPKNVEKTYTYYRVDTDPETGDSKATKLDGAPVDAGDYRVVGTATKKGYKINVEDATFTINKRTIPILIDPNVLTAYYNPTGTYEIPYKESVNVKFESYSYLGIDQDELDEDFSRNGEFMLPADRAKGAKVVGTIRPKLAEGDTVFEVGKKYALDLSNLKVQFSDGTYSSNYAFALSGGDLNADEEIFTIVSAPVKDSWIVFDNEDGKFPKYDIGETEVSFKVYYNGVVSDENLLVKDRDYQIAGDTSAEDNGDAHIVQIKGINNYTDFAEKEWTLAYDEEDRAAALKTFTENGNVTVALTDATAGLKNGQKKITTKVVGTVNDGFTITRTGVVYYTGDDAQAILTRENAASDAAMFDMGRTSVTTYTANIPADGTVRVVGYVVANNGQYETVIYTEEQPWTYDDLVNYTVSVVGGTIIGTEDADYATYNGTQIKNDKPVIKVKVADVPEGQKFYCWEKNGVIASYNESFAFSMPEKNVTVSAVYVDADEEIEAKAATYIDSITPTTTADGKRKISYVTMSSVPIGCNIVQAGLIFALNEPVDKNKLIKANYPDNVRGKATNATNYKYTWTKGYNDNEVYYVRAFVEYEQDGINKEAYGDDVYKVTFTDYELVE